MREIVSDEKIGEEVRKAIEGALPVDVLKIEPDHVLTLDLNAESLDFLDINYSIEQAFGIRMARHFLLEHAEERFGEGVVIDKKNLLTPKGVELLRLRFGKEAEKLKPGDHLEAVQSLLTVRAIEDRVKEILDTLPEICESCGASNWISEDGAKIKCGNCEESPAFKSGDDLQLEWLDRVQREERLFDAWKS
jgi:acyl carrier protein